MERLGKERRGRKRREVAMSEPETSEPIKKSGKKLDMGKGCVRFKSLHDLALDVVGRVAFGIGAWVYLKT
jgi:hypothetical protein